MPENVRPWALLPLLEQHKNLGCDPELGRAGRIIDCTLVPKKLPITYEFTIRLDAIDSIEARTASIEIKRETLTRRGISTDLVFRLISSRVLVMIDTTDQFGQVFFFYKPDEVVRFLQTVLAHLSQKNDAISRELHQRLTKIKEESEWANSALCVDLNHLREESLTHVRKILRDAPNRTKVMEALDRGEALSILESPSHDKRNATDLSDHETQTLINIVRSRYAVEVLQCRTASTKTKLTPLGEKIFGARKAQTLTPQERDHLFILAAQAFDKSVSKNSNLGHVASSLVT